MTGQPITGPVRVFSSTAYVADGSTFDTVHKAGAIAEAISSGAVEGATLRAPTPARPDELERIHHPRYVEAVCTGEPRHLAASAGLGWDEALRDSVLAMAGGCRDAAIAAWPHGVAGTLSSGLHHARAGEGTGYCTINGVALAAVTFFDLGASRVLVVDLDAHCGGGTHDILGTDPRVQSLDVSTDSFDSYDPPGGSTLDVVRDPADYLPTIEARLAAIDPAGIEAVVYNAGMDPHEDCGTGGLDGIDDDTLERREHLVFSWATRTRIPITFAFAGGYSAGAMGQRHLTDLHLLTVGAAAMACSAQGGTRP